MKFALLALLVPLHSLRAADVEIIHHESAGTLSSAHKARIEAVRSLWDWLLLDNGLTGPSAVVRVVIKPARMGAGGPLAECRTSSYKINGRGKLVIDGQYPVTISLNIDQSLNQWSDLLMGAVIFHEMAHCFG